jgi:hypothetical protein
VQLLPEVLDGLLVCAQLAAQLRAHGQSVQLLLNGIFQLPMQPGWQQLRKQ